MKRKILSLLLALCLVVGMVPLAASAEETSLPDPVDGVITLTDDVVLSGTQTINLEGLTIETDGYTLIVSEGANVTIEGNGTIKNDKVAEKEDEVTDLHDLIDVASGGTLVISGGIFKTKSAQALNVSGTAIVNNGTFELTMEQNSMESSDYTIIDGKSLIHAGANSQVDIVGGNFDASAKYMPTGNEPSFAFYGIYAENGANVILGNESTSTGPVIKSGYAAIGLNNTTSNPPVSITIYGGEYSADLGGFDVKYSSVLYLSGQSNVQIVAGTFKTDDDSGNTSIVSIPYANTSVSLDISGGSFEADNAKSVIRTYGGSGSTSGQKNDISVSGGTFTVKKDGQVFVFAEADKIDDFVTGGIYKTNSDEKVDISNYIPEDTALTQDENGVIVMDDKKDIAAQIGEVGYTSLQAAINYAGADDTIVVLKNVALSSSLNIGSKQNITIQGKTPEVTISCGEENSSTKAVFSGTPAGSFTLKDLTFDDAVVTINGMDGAMNVEGCTFQNLEYPTSSKLGAINFTGAKNRSSLSVNNCVFKNLKKNSGAAEVVGIYTQAGSNNAIDSISVTNSTFDTIQGTALSLRNSPDVTITGNTFKNWAAADSGKNDGRAVRLDFSNQTVQNLTFKENKMVAGSGAKESYLKVDHVTKKSSLDVSNNYWDAKDPVTGTTTGTTTPVLEILLEGNNVALTSKELASNPAVKGEEAYYTKDTMNSEDLSTYEPPYIPPVVTDPTYTNTVSDTENGKVTASPTRPKEGATVTITTTPDKGYEVGSVSVTDADGKAVAVTNAGNGKYTFKQPDSKVTIKVTFVWDNPFTDVGNAWYRNAIQYVYENNLMAGTGDTTFDPEVSLTRAMTAQILYNLEGQPKVDEEATFADMNEAPTWSVDAIAWAQDTGVVAGMGDNQFAPNLKVTREQFAQMMYNYAKYKKYDLTKTGDLSKFPDDGSVSDWAETALSWANGNGLINGHAESGLLDPQGNTIRGQAASIIMNFDKNVVK